MNSKSVLISVLLWLGLVVSACAPVVAPATTPASQATAVPVTLKMALIPVLDSLPVYVAEQENLFQAHGVQVEIIPVSSAPERDQLISTGQADGMINEALSTMFYNKDQVQVQTVRYGRTATSDSPLFRILSTPGSGIRQPQDLKNVEIGISQGTIIEYLTYRLLEAEGLTTDEIKTTAVPQIDARMELLNSGQLKAAMLPDPVSSLSMQRGAQVVLDDTRHPDYSFSTYTFRKEVIDAHPKAIRAFLAAIEEAVTKMNADPGGWTSLLSEKKLVPAPLLGEFKLPRYVTAGVPSEAQWQDVLAWAKERGLLTKDVSYQDSVTASYLPIK